MRWVKRNVALRVISAYRVSHEAVAILSGQVPIEILAEEISRLYTRLCALKDTNVPLTERLCLGIGNLERATSINIWKGSLKEAGNYPASG